MLGMAGYGGGVVRDDEEGSDKSMGEGDREGGRGISAGVAGGVGEIAAIFTDFGTGLRSLRLAGAVTLEGCLTGGFCFPF